MSRYRNLTLILAATALAATAAPCLADSMRCGNLLIVEGDTAGKLRSRCGDPASISRKSVLRTPSVVWVKGRPLRVGNETEEMQVETWEYNFGPRRLIQRVRLEDGLVKSIDTLGYGYP
jgi:hypothetical protein